MDLQDLFKPYPAAEIEWRVGSTNSDKSSGLALAYLTARHVMDRLDAVCGPENWQDRYEFHGARTVCYLSIRINADDPTKVSEWVTKADGAGDSDVEAEKGAISDALKRAAVKWGIGRYLYDLGNIWVDVEPAGRSVKIKKSQYAKLQNVLDAQFGPTKMAGPPTSEEKSVEAEETYTVHLLAIQTAKTLDLLQTAFLTAKADKSLSHDQGKKLIIEKDIRKAALMVPSNYSPPVFDEKFEEPK